MKKLSLLSLAATLALCAEPVTIEKISVEDEMPAADITANQLAASRSITMTGDSAAILADVPGVSIYNNGGTASLPVIHGLADDRVKIDIDGMTVTSACPNHMNPALSYIDTSKIETIEVMAGITPVSEGGDSIGGTIVVQSKEPLFAQNPGEVIMNGEMSGFYRSNGQSRGASLNATAANDTISVDYSGFAEKTDDYKNGDGAIVKDSLHQQQNHAVALAYKIDGDNAVSLKFAKTYVDFAGFPNEYMDMLDNKSASVNLSYKGRIGNLLLDANAYRQKTDHYMNKIWGERAPYNPSKPYGMPMYTEAVEMGYNLKATLPVSKAHTLKFGSDYDKYTLNDWWPPAAAPGSTVVTGMGPDTFWNINDGHRNRLGLYAEGVSQWNEQFSSVIGFRTDLVKMDTGDVVGYNTATNAMANDPVDAAAFNAADHKKKDNNVDFTAMGKYEYSDTADLELGYSRKTRSPNVYERYAWAGSSGSIYTNPVLMDMRMVNWFGDGNGYTGNLDLKPETANTLSATLSLHDAGQKEWGVKLTPYYTKVNDYIDIDLVNTAADGRRYFRFANADAHLFGADLSGYAILWDNSENGRGTLKGSLGYTRGLRDSGGSLYHMMPLHAKISFDRVSGVWNNGIDIESVAKKESVDTLRNEPVTAGYALVDLRTGYAWSKQLKMDFSITNLFDKDYAMPLGGVDVVNYSASAYTPLQEMGRSFNAGLTYAF